MVDYNSGLKYENQKTLNRKKNIMNLFLIKAITGLKDNYVGWDCNHGFVVRAKDEKEARLLVSKNIDEDKIGDENKNTWLDSKLSTCCEISKKGPTEIILVDYG